MGWSEIAGAASQVGGALINWGASKYNTDKTNLANKQMAEYAYSKDLEMWNRQNAYNSPEAQMARFKAAGLNPNLIYGSGGSAGNATTLPRYNAPTMRYNYQPPDFTSVIGTFQDMKLKQAQIDLVSEQAKGKSISNDIQSYTGMVKAINEAELSNFRKLTSRANLMSNPYAYEDIRNALRPRLEELANLKIDMLHNQLAKYSADTKKSMADTLLKGAELELRNKDVNWYTANQISKMFSGVATGLGLAGIGRSIFTGSKPTINMPASPNFSTYVRTGIFKK